MIRLALGDLRARPIRLLATVLSVALGVAFVAGSLILIDTVRGAFDRRFIEGGQHAAGVVRPTGGQETQRYARVPDRVADTVAAVPGVAAVAPVHQETVVLTSPSGQPLDRQDAEASRLDQSRSYVGNWIDQAALRDQELRAGRPPAAPGEVALHQHTAAAYGLAIGNRVRLVLTYTVLDATVTGLFDYAAQDPAPDALLLTPMALVSTDVTAERLGDPGSLRMLTAAGADPAKLRAAVTQALGGSGYEIVPAETANRDTFGLLLRSSLGPLSTMLLVFAGITVLAAGMIVFTTFTVTVAQRTRQYGLLRTVGASRGQITAAVLVEALGIGLVGAAAGVLLGVAMAAGLRLLFDAVGVELVVGPDDPLVLRPTAVAIATVTGMVAAVLAAFLPAVRASRVPPLQALREPEQPARPGTGGRLALAGLLVLAASIATLALTLVGVDGSEEDVAARLVPLGAGALGVFLAMALLAPRCTGPVARLVGGPAAALRGFPARLARANATRSPGRTALTATTLLLGVALVSYTLVFSTSLEATQEARIQEVHFTDFEIRAEGLSSFPGEASEAVAAVEGVQTATAIRPAQVSLDGSPRLALAVEPRTLMEVTDVQTRGGDFAALAGDTGTGPGRVVLAADVAAGLGVGVGDTVPLTFIGGGEGAGEVPTRVVATYDPDSLPFGFGQDLLVSRDRAAAADPLQGDTLTLVALRDGVTVEQARPALQAALRGFPVVLRDAEEARASATGRISSVLSLGLGLLLLTVVIAVFGVTNTLALSVTERTRELALLRAVGMSRTQTRAMIRWEAVIVTLLGALLGLILGVFFAWGTARAVPSEIEVFALPVGWLAITVAVAVAAGLLAATVPARRASRVDVLRAIAIE
jgi:putative ABC transport system permease protein